MDSPVRSQIDLVPWKTGQVVLGTALVILATILAGAIYLAIDRDSESAPAIDRDPESDLAIDRNPESDLAIDRDPESGRRFAAVAGLGFAILVLVPLVMGPVIYRVSVGSLGLKLPASRTFFQLLLPPLVLIGSLVIGGIYLGIVSLAGGDIPQSLPEQLILDGPGLIATVALVVIMGPFAEEVFFRGFVFAGLVGRLGVIGAGLGSALLFTLAHISDELDQNLVLPPIFATALLLTWLYRKSGSIWSCFAAHALQNALALGVSL